MQISITGFSVLKQEDVLEGGSWELYCVQIFKMRDRIHQHVVALSLNYQGIGT